MYCQQCIVSCHEALPLHMLRVSLVFHVFGTFYNSDKEWTGLYWVRRTLKELGLVIQLGHRPGEQCYLPKAPYADDFVIINSNGIHSVALRFCGCETAGSHLQQLLRFRLFPATTDKPKTAATFSVLEEFHLLSFESKVSVYHYYNALARRNNGAGLSPPKVVSSPNRQTRSNLVLFRTATNSSCVWSVSGAT